MKFGFSWPSGFREFEDTQGTAGYIVGQIPALKPPYVPGIPGPKGLGHTNDCCIVSQPKHLLRMLHDTVVTIHFEIMHFFLF